MYIYIEFRRVVGTFDTHTCSMHLVEGKSCFFSNHVPSQNFRSLLHVQVIGTLERNLGDVWIKQSWNLAVLGGEDAVKTSQ